MKLFITDIREWLDTETRAILCPEPPKKWTEVGTESYSLLLLNEGKDRRRIEDVVKSIRSIAPPRLSEYPFIVGQGMEYEYALAGQFALACCDCVTAFVRDEVVEIATVQVFRQLHSEVMKSPEFEKVELRIHRIPQSEEGRRFCWQFFGLATGLRVPGSFSMFRKKARLMEHWAERLGISVDNLARPIAES